ncbi:hypothetical protein K1T71_014620 [Dendrolimus kikuchii]|uniref:Uncharacterized protein n=1 Tax=Dendrolimus kikuchii TaxID=765133 RepID=A0ACC1CEL9_9NEOP|nr:hypothetical protein K1T71_014620 [Dendrolimus kikuchii]
MEAKTSEWRPGPTVCRCCLTEGCYKDISTEYFWMGKREVYSEMLSETFSVSISYSKSGGPNSQSRLICEQCISRLRDAADFKRQVVECEKMFMQHLDPGTSSVVEFSVPQVESSEKVKLERVKVEKVASDDDFDDGGFPDDDDDDDDLDDQPLMKLASKIPKKESLDLRDLLDNTKLVLKRKAPPTSKSKPVVPTKKLKSKKEVGRPTETNILDEEIEIKQEVEFDTENLLLRSNVFRDGKEKRAAFRNNITTIIEWSTAYPFKYRKGVYLCFFCKHTFIEPEKLREHTRSQHAGDMYLKLKKYDPLKMDFAMATCKLCGLDVSNYMTLQTHFAEHGRVIDNTLGEFVLPYQLNKEEHCCQICGKTYEMFLSLHRHMNDHYHHFICETCGKRFVTSHRMINHARTHERGQFPCKKCKEIFPTYASLCAHGVKIHRSNQRYKCPICDEKFSSYKRRLKHLNVVHGEKTAVFPCPSCPKVFDLCSRRTAHIKFQHLQERKHVCSVCGMKFFTNYELQEHSIKHGGERIYQCDVCKKSYARLKTLREHMRIHNNDRRYVCNVCGQAFIQNCSLKQHMRVHHPANLKDIIYLNNDMISSTKIRSEKFKRMTEDHKAKRKQTAILLEFSKICPFRWAKNLFICFYCDRQYSDPCLLKEHNNKEHDNVNTAQLVKVEITDIICKLCNNHHNDLSELKRHLLDKHQINIDPKSDGGVLPFRLTQNDFKCVICDSRYTDYKSLNHHMNVHFQYYICEQCGSGFITPHRLRSHGFSHETGAFRCDDCFKYFRSTNARNEHYATVHLKVKRHRCPHCSETFRNYFQRNKHIASDHGLKLKEFKCNLCPKVFTLSGKLSFHIRTVHLKLKRFACDVCEWKFYSRSELREHMVRHGGERKYQCNVCKKAYARKYTLKEHIRIHENDRRYVCTICGKAFLQNCSLKHHMKIHHPNQGLNKDEV